VPLSKDYGCDHIRVDELGCPPGFGDPDAPNLCHWFSDGWQRGRDMTHEPTLALEAVEAASPTRHSPP
jgi:hypothetical protein